MEKKSYEMNFTIQSQNGGNYDNWLPNLDLDLSWSAILRAFFKILTNKLRLNPPSNKRPIIQPKWW